MKFGEYPAFGPRIPSRLLRTFESDKELFFKGRQAENQGLGVGAFAYYRQIVERQFARLLEKMAEAAKSLGASDDLAILVQASKDNQFTKAVNTVKDHIPEGRAIAP